MRLATIAGPSGPRLAVRRGGDLIDLSSAAPDLPTTMVEVLEGGTEALEVLATAAAAAPTSAVLDPASVIYLPVIPRPGKIVCVGLNYADHSAESGFTQPDYPTLFGRFATSLVGHGRPLVRPRLSY